MSLSKLGYTAQWKYAGILTDAKLEEQLEEFEKSEDKDTANYRYASLIDWIKSKKEFTDKDIENFFEITIEEEDQIMGGMAIKELFASPLLTDQQFDTLKQNLPEFGKWTAKVIEREDLNRRLSKSEVSKYLYAECLNYYTKYDDSRLLIRIIKESDNIEILKNFASNGCGKRIRKMAEKKINQIERENAK